jgi:hypothetical protein
MISVEYSDIDDDGIGEDVGGDDTATNSSSCSPKEEFL